MNHQEQEFLTQLNTHKGILHKISRMYMDEPDDQDDLVQEIICQLWKAYGSFRSESKFSTWMYRVAINTAIVFFKKEKKRISSSPLEHLDIKDDHKETETKESQLSHLYKALQKLEKVEKAIVFYHMEGYSHREIAQNIGLSEVNTRVRLNRAKTKLKELIKQQGYEF